MATIPLNFTIQPRKSMESDRRYLLADSVSPSESASMIFDEGDATPRARSPVRAEARSSAAPLSRCQTIATPTPYKGYPSEEEYLAALRAWAEERKYIQFDTMLTGFYGQKTMAEYVKRCWTSDEFGVKEEVEGAEREEAGEEEYRYLIEGSRLSWKGVGIGSGGEEVYIHRS